MAYFVMFGSMFAMLLIGVPIGVALAGAMILLLFVEPVTSMTFVTQAMYTGVGGFPCWPCPSSSFPAPSWRPVVFPSAWSALPTPS